MKAQRRNQVQSESMQLSGDRVNALLRPHAIDRKQHPLVFLGLRGYFKSLGDPAANDRGIYDDMIAICTPTTVQAYRANTDPAGYRAGHGTGADKGLACLEPGCYLAYRFDLHRDRYLALCQRANEVTVRRDGNPPYLDTGYFGINIHQGGNSETWSEGCQTLPYDDWPGFIDTATRLAKQYHGEHWQSQSYHYVLVDMTATRSYIP